MTSSPHGPYGLGYTYYNGDNGLIPKAISVQLGSATRPAKSESLCQRNSADAVNTFRPCTPPVTPWELGLPDDSALTLPGSSRPR